MRTGERGFRGEGFPEPADVERGGGEFGRGFEASSGFPYVLSNSSTKLGVTLITGSAAVGNATSRHSLLKIIVLRPRFQDALLPVPATHSAS
jgi:hypothetical protein